MLKIEVEATSANICVGFDVLGLALDLKNTFTFTKASTTSFEGFKEEFSTKETNLVYEAYKLVFDKAKEDIVDVKIGYKGDIPLSRGLGSSSSLIVAGIFAANYFLNNKYTKDELFLFATELEGHPDNVAPAIYGGLVASYKNIDGYHPIKYETSSDLKFTVLIPPYEVSTKMARNVLPKSLEYKDIVWNLSRIVNIPYAFKNGDISLLKDLFNDKLHEPYRKELIKDYDKVYHILKDKECAMAISGSGSCMLVVSKDLSFIKELENLDLKIKTLNVGVGVSLEEIWKITSIT